MTITKTTISSTDFYGKHQQEQLDIMENTLTDIDREILRLDSSMENFNVKTKTYKMHSYIHV
jgi:archaellum component FlaC